LEGKGGERHLNTKNKRGLCGKKPIRQRLESQGFGKGDGGLKSGRGITVNKSIKKHKNEKNLEFWKLITPIFNKQGAGHTARGEPSKSQQ